MSGVSPWTVLGWILVGWVTTFAVAFGGCLLYAAVKVFREAQQHHRDAKASARGVPTSCGLCARPAEFRTESGSRCARHLTVRSPAGRKSYSERIMSDA